MQSEKCKMQNAKGDGSGLLTMEQVEEFRERGFLKVGKVLTDEQTRTLRARLDDVMEGRSKAQPEAKRNLLGDGSDTLVVQVVNIWEADDAFRGHLYNPLACGMAAQL